MIVDNDGKGVPNMRRSLLLIVLCLCTTWSVPGCSSSPPPPQPAVPKAVSVSPAAQANPGNLATVAKPKPKPVQTERRSTIPSDADPKTIFAVESIGQRMDVVSKRGADESDLFEIAAGDLRFDSSNFEVQSSRPSAQSQMLIGTGQLKPGFTLPKGFEVIKEAGYSKDGLPMRILCERTGTKLALVPGGTSIVGTDDGPPECKPSFTVRLDTFYMELLEVTVINFDRFRSEMREKKKPVPPQPSNPSSPPGTPALGLSWAASQNYARWAGMELPTEAEYEKAARGPNGLRTPWGDGRALWQASRTFAATGANAGDTSPYGIFDLAGNAKEWCADLYSPTAHADAVASATDIPYNWSGPRKTRDTNLRVVKGNGNEWSAWHREGKDMGKGHNDVGFRCVLRIPPDPKSKDSSRS